MSVHFFFIETFIWEVFAENSSQSHEVGVDVGSVFLYPVCRVRILPVSWGVFQRDHSAGVWQSSKASLRWTILFSGGLIFDLGVFVFGRRGGGNNLFKIHVYFKRQMYKYGDYSCS